jgi:uncharacterized membrane protein YkvA (DUF1232 family)
MAYVSKAHSCSYRASSSNSASAGPADSALTPGRSVQVLAVYYALQHPRTPLLSKSIAFLVLAYALSPLDLIPDFIPILGILDDLVSWARMPHEHLTRAHLRMTHTTLRLQLACCASRRRAPDPCMHARANATRVVHTSQPILNLLAPPRVPSPT